MTLDTRSPALPRSLCRAVALVLATLLGGGGDLLASQRGSVRTANRSGGTWSNPRSSGSTSTTRSGSTASRTTTAETRSGRSGTAEKNVSREGDTVTVDRSVQGSQGASASSQKEYEFDDGRVESVERSASATDRYGRTAQWEGKAEREGYGWEFEGEGKNRYGQHVEVDGYGARGYYGTGVVADVEGGRYGNRTVVAGKPYGGPTYVRTLPYGARPYMYHGRSYYHHGGVYYRPYTVHGVVVYGYVPPPYYTYYSSPPVGAIALVVAGAALLYADGAYYQKTSSGGTTQYQVVPAPTGASIPGTSLPADRASVTAGGQTYFLYGNTFYRRVVTNGQESFVTVTRPPGVMTVTALPPDVDAVPVGSLTYFTSGGRFYLPYLDPAGAELYVVVNPPAGAKTAATGAAKTGATVPASAPVVRPQRIDLTVAAGTSIQALMLSDVSSASAAAGQRFQAALGQDLLVNGRLVAPKGAHLSGRVVASKAGTGTGGAPALSLELTELETGGLVYAIGTTPVQLGAPGKKPTKKILGGAALGAGIGAVIDGGEGAAIGAAVGAVAGTAAAAASSGNQVVAAAGTALAFPLARSLTVSVLVASSTMAN